MAFSWEKASADLRAPLDTAAIRQPAPGKFGEYVDGLHVITEANRIFGHDGWSYEVTRLEQAACQVFDLKGRDGPYQQVRAAYVCTVRVTVHGVTREGAACGTGNGKPENIGDVIESAVKEAETDALKRALRSFGNTFGLALYEKDKSKRQVASAPPPPPKMTNEDKRDWVAAAMATCETVADLKAFWSRAKIVSAVADLPESMQQELTAQYNDIFNALDTAELAATG